MINQKADKAVKEARTRLILRQRFYGLLSHYLTIAQSEKAATIATEGKHFFYNPDYFLSLSNDERIGKWAQAVTHCAYKHPMRRSWREPSRWNLACAYVVNYDLVLAGFHLTEDSVVDAKYVGMAAEEVYALLEADEQQKQPQPDPGDGEGAGQGDSGSDSGEGGGDGQGDGQPDKTGSDPGQGPANSKERDPGGAGEVFDAAEAHDVNSNKDAAHDWEQHTRQAIAITKAANAGSVPGYLERLVETLNEPRIDWRELTRQWIDNSSVKVDTWNRPNRRFLSMGIYLPSQVVDRPNHLVFVGDTSGSMTARLLQEITTEIKAAQDEGSCDRLTVIWTDTKVQGVQEFQDGDELHLKPRGGGGTDFRKVMGHIRSNVEDPTAIVFFTDLLVDNYGEQPDCPLLWAVHGNKRQFERLAAKAPFGEAIFVDYT